MDAFFNQEIPDSEIVTQWLNEASYVQSGAEKLEIFHKVQEYILRKTPALLPEFIDNILNFTMDKNADIKKALVGFIEEACKINEAMLPKVSLTLQMLLTDKSVPVQKKVIQVAILIYKKTLMWICKENLITEEMEKAWNSLTAIKTEIISLIDSDNDGIRTSAVKFLESIVLIQSYPDSESKIADFSLEDVPLTLKLVRRRKLEEEAKKVFETLINFNTSSHISSANLFAVIGALTNIGKNRPCYISDVVESIVKLHSNMPPTLSTMQVNSVRKKLKMELLTLIKHNSSLDYIEQISKMLLDLGCSQSEINKVTPKIDPEKRKAAKRSLKEQESNLQSAKKQKMDEENLQLQLLAIEANEEFIFDNLNVNTASQLVLKCLEKIPEAIPDNFAAELLDAKKMEGPELKIIAKLLAPQFVEAGVGPGTKFIGKTTLIKATDVDKEKNNMEVDEELPVEKEKIKPKVVPKLPRLKTLKLNEVTRPLDRTTKQNLLIGSIKRLLQVDRKINTPIRQKIITTVAASFSENVRHSVLSHLLYDLKNNLDLALSWLYEEYSIMQGFLRVPELRKEGRIDQNYNTLLNAFVSTASSDAVMLSRLLLEAPMVTEVVLDQLCIICRDEQRSAWSMGLLRDLILRRPTRQNLYLNALLVHTTYDLQKIRENALNHITELYKNEKLQNEIENYTKKLLDYVKEKQPPDNLFGHIQGRLDICENFNDELLKITITPYLTILPKNGQLLKHLTQIYIEANGDVKRIILKQLETPIKTMGMNNNYILDLLENCPKNSETLLTRIIQILTDKNTPNEKLIEKVREIYQTKITDVRFLIPVLNGLTKKEIITVLPKLIKLNPVVVKEVFNRLLGFYGDSNINPTELLVNLHLIDSSQCDLKTLIKATSICLQDRQIYTQEVLAVVLQQLMEYNPLPTLIMRTVIQALSYYPRLSGFVLNILQRLIVKHVWKQKVVWEGFIKCCQRCQPQSFSVLFQLPGPQLKEAIEFCPELKEPLKEHLGNFSESQKQHVPQLVLEMLLGQIAPPGAPEVILPPLQPEIASSEPLPPGME